METWQVEETEETDSLWLRTEMRGRSCVTSSWCARPWQAAPLTQILSSINQRGDTGTVIPRGRLTRSRLRRSAPQICVEIFVTTQPNQLSSLTLSTLIDATLSMLKVWLMEISHVMSSSPLRRTIEERIEHWNAMHRQQWRHSLSLTKTGQSFPPFP